MPAAQNAFTDPLHLIVVIGAGLIAIATGLTMFYGLPHGSARIAERQSYIVWHQIRSRTAVGARHLWPAMVPAGVSCVLLGLGGFLVAAGWPWLLIGFVAVLVAFIAFAFTFLMAIRPPKRFLPQWWAVEEDRRRAGLEPLIAPPKQGKVPTMTGQQRTLAVLFLVAMGLLGVMFRLPTVVVVAGVSAGVVYLAAVRVRE